MKKTSLIIAYFSFVAFVFAINSCQKEQFSPNSTQGLRVDSTWVNDSTGGPIDPNTGGGIIINDSTIWGNPNDSTGGWNPNDSLGGPFDPNTGGGIIIISDSIN